MPHSGRQLDPLSTSAGAAGSRPTSVRYGVLAFSVAMAVILYLDRMAISVAMPAIAADLDLELTQVGDAVAVFFWCYGLFQVPSGWLGDRWGGRRALTLYVVAWSAAMAGLGLAGGLATLILMRALLGIGQAGAYATTASFLRRWMPFGRRGFANSAVSLGGRAGGVLAPALTPLLMGLVIGVSPDAAWRPVFLGYALIGLVWAGAFWFWFRDEPGQHRDCNAAEVALIHQGEAATHSASAQTVGMIPLGALLANRGVQVLSVINFCVNVGWIFLATWLPTYLMTVHSCTTKEAGLYTSFTAASGMAGCLCGGLATDFLVKRVGLLWGRRIPGVISYGGAAVGLACVWAANDVGMIVTLLVVTSFLGDFALGANWATYQDIGGRYAGTVLGWTNMCGNIGAALAVSVIGRLVDNYGWSATFAMSSTAYVIGAVGWLLVDPRVAIRLADTSAPTPAPAE